MVINVLPKKFAASLTIMFEHYYVKIKAKFKPIAKTAT